MPADSSEPDHAAEGVTTRLRGDTERTLLELARDEQRWIRARMLPEGLYELRHREGPGADRYELFTSDHVLVRDILFAWLDDNPWWREAVAWARVDPAIAEIEAVRGELSELLDGFGLLGAFEELDAGLDDAMRRADELLSGFDDDAGASPDE